ncbi:MAG: ribosome maturation factor RimM [Ruminococcus sp.]|nr:ribosome maturation factor RimM [Ruminococcus sp.]
MKFKQFLEAGKVISVFGVNGEVVISPMCDSPETLVNLKTLYLNKGETPVSVIGGFVRKTNAVLKIAGINTVEIAHTYIGKIFYLDRNDIKLPVGTYFHADLLGIEVCDIDSAEVYGEITEITSNGAHDIYHVKSKKGKISLIPAVAEFVKFTDIEARKILIKTVEGLIEADED